MNKINQKEQILQINTMKNMKAAKIENIKSSDFETLVSGMTSGIIARTLTHPLERLRII